MTYREWEEVFVLLNFDTSKLLKMTNKLNKFKIKGKQKSFNTLLHQAQLDFMYVKKLFDILDKQSYWHKEHLDKAKWNKYKDDVKRVFICLESLIPERMVR